MESPDGEVARAKRLHILLVGIVVLVAVAVVYAGLQLYSFSPRRMEPTVDQLIENYRAHRTVFAALARMVPLDSDFAIWNPPLGPDDERYGMPTHLSAKREAQYRKLLAEIGGKQMGWGAGEIGITLGSEGFFNTGLDWGYFHTNRLRVSPDATESARAGGSPEGWSVLLGDGWYANLNRN